MVPPSARPAGGPQRDFEDEPTAMDANETKRLIKRMLEKGDLMPETREDLEDHLADLDKGTLHPEDAAYVESLARRLGFAGGGPPPAAGDDDDGDDDDDDDDVFFGDEPESDTAAAVQAEIALRKVNQARDLTARLREMREAETPDGPTAETPSAEAASAEAASAEAATLAELQQALDEAADALQRDG